METTLFEVKLKDGRIFRVFCHGKNQIKRFKEKLSQIEETVEILATVPLANGINTIKEFEQLCNSN